MAGRWRITRKRVMRGSRTTASLAGVVLVVSALVGAGTGPSMVQAQGSPFATGSSPTWVVVGDFDRTGKVDLAVTNFNSSDVTVLLGDGRGGFIEASGSPFSVAPGEGPRSIAVGDFNADKKLDMATANAMSDDVTVLLGDGGGGFTPAPGSPFGAGAGPESIAAGDFDRKRGTDLAVVNFNSNDVTVLLADSQGGFTQAPGSPNSVAPGQGPRSVGVGDFTGDRRADLAVANEFSGDVTVLVGDGRGQFTEAAGSPVSLAPGLLAMSLTVADLDSDGNADVAAANLASNDVTVLLGDGQGGFRHAPGSPIPLSPSLGSVSVGVTDLDDDGASDLAAVGEFSHDVSLMLGDGQGRFAEASWLPISVLPGAMPVHVVAADFDSDARPDLVTVNFASDNVTVLLNRF